MLMINQQLFIVALVCAIGGSHWGVISVTGQLSCVDESGKPVDWFVGYKFPTMKGEFGSGGAYAYVSSEDVKEEANDDLQFNREVKNDDAKIFLRRFKDLLMKFAGPFSRQEILRPEPAGPRTRARSPSPSSSARDGNSNNNNKAKQLRWQKSKINIYNSGSVLLKTLAPAYDERKFNKISSIYYNDDPRNTNAPDKLLDKSASSRSTGKDYSSDEVSDSGSDEDSDKEVAKPIPNSKNQERKKKPDGPWENKQTNAAHAKGLILMDEKSNTGVWITHSIPRFPVIRATNSHLKYPKSALKNAQTFMCVTFDLDKSGPKLFDHLINMRALVYDRLVTDSLEKRFPRLQYLDLWIKMARRSNRGTGESELTQVITTKGGQILRLFSKPRSVEKDLYSFIDDAIGADLSVETWRIGAGGKVSSKCPKNDFHINNVDNLKYDTDDTWGYQLDHSKWAISDEEEIATVCIGDSNRVESQFKRGGGAVCIRNPSIWAVFNNTVASVEGCPLGERKGGGQSMNLDPTVKTRVEQYMKAVTEANQ